MVHWNYFGSFHLLWLVIVSIVIKLWQNDTCVINKNKVENLMYKTITLPIILIAKYTKINALYAVDIYSILWNKEQKWSFCLICNLMILSNNALWRYLSWLLLFVFLLCSFLTIQVVWLLLYCKLICMSV